MPTLHEGDPSPVDEFAAAIDQKFHGLQDPNCRVDAPYPQWQSMTLYPSEAVEGIPQPERVKLTTLAAGADLERESKEVLAPPLISFQVNSPASEHTVLYHSQSEQIFRRDRHLPWHDPSDPMGSRMMLVHALGEQTLGDSLLTFEEKHWATEAREFGRPIGDTEAQHVIAFINSLRERPAQLYREQSEHEGFWTSRFRLPEALPRQAVLELLGQAVQSVVYNPDVPLDEVPHKSLSGALLGPGDIETVEEIIFARDPSQRYGVRDDFDSDHYIARLAAVHGWKELNQPGEHTPGYMRTIMGRNKDKYDSEVGAFSFEEACAMLGLTTALTTTKAHLFSNRPALSAAGPFFYNEPAIIVEGYASTLTQEDHLTSEIAELAWKLNRQDRWVLETLARTIVYKSNA